MRDLRDPQKLGEYILSEAKHQKKTAAQVYDNNVQHFNVPDVSKDDSMGKQCVAEYRAELETRTDKYAKSALDMLNNGELPKR